MHDCCQGVRRKRWTVPVLVYSVRHGAGHQHCVDHRNRRWTCGSTRSSYHRSCRVRLQTAQRETKN